MLVSWFCIVVFSLSSHGAYFFKSKDSLFPSGYKDSEVLYKKKNKEVRQKLVKVQWAKNQKAWLNKKDLVERENLFTHIDFSKSLRLHKKASFESPSIISEAGRKKICSIKNEWMKLCGLGWVHRSNVYGKLINYKSLGYGYSITNGPLFSEANYKKPLGKITAGERVLVLAKEKGFFLIQLKNKKYYFPKEDILDINKLKKGFVFTNKKWLRSYGNEEQILKGFKVYSKIAEKEISWFRSYLYGHGQVWWQERPQERIKKSYLSSKDVFSKKVYDMSRSKKEGLSLVVAQGVYRSFDNETWQKIPYFENKNYPVLISKDNTIYLGEYYSKNRGETFQKMIHWQELIQSIPMIENAKVHILEIEESDAGIHYKIKVKDKIFSIAKNQTNHWQLANFPKKIDLANLGL